MSYNLKAIQDRLFEMQNGGKPRNSSSGGGKKDTGPKLPFWKPEHGDNHIRLLPYQDRSGQPFHQVSYYASELLVGQGYRQVAPFQFGEEDPIHEYATMLGQSHQPPDVYKIMLQLRPKDSFYAPVLVRGQEDKGVQVWELTPTRVQAIYAILAHPDYIDEDLTHPETGKDFLVSVSDSDKMFKDNVVKNFIISERKKSTPLAKTAKEREDLVASIPDFDAYFKGRLRPTDAYRTMLENALAGGPAATSSKGNSAGTARNPERDQEAVRNIEDAFADLDD
jgi:hypothetical protein